MSLRLPLTPDEVTCEWLTEALTDNHPGVVVTQAHLDDVLWGTATKLRFQVAYNHVGRSAELPESIIVKGGFAEHRERMSYLYEMEARFYRELQPQLSINVPRCYFTGDDKQRHQHLVILEDLQARKVRFCRVQHPLSFEQAAAYMDLIAGYTAQWWGSSTLNHLQLQFWDPLPDGEMGSYQWGQLNPDVWRHYMQLPRGAAVPKQFHNRDQMERALLNLKAFDRKGPMTFLHGDFHLGNLYHDADGTPAVLDWQSYCQGPWSHDVSYFLISALDIADRRKWDRALLAHYLERLSAHGVAPPSFEVAWDAFRRQVIDGLFFWLVNPVEWQAEENNCAVTPRFAAAAFDHDTFELMG